MAIYRTKFTCAYAARGNVFRNEMLLNRTKFVYLHDLFDGSQERSLVFLNDTLVDLRRAWFLGLKF